MTPVRFDYLREKDAMTLPLIVGASVWGLLLLVGIVLGARNARAGRNMRVTNTDYPTTRRGGSESDTGAVS